MKATKEAQMRFGMFIGKLFSKLDNESGADWKVKLTVDDGSKYWRIWKASALIDENGRIRGSGYSNRSAYCFVSKETGDILKPATWKGPAKHARGNIYSDDYGLSGCGLYGVAYLR